MIEFLFGTLIQILFIQTDLNRYLKYELWTAKFWKFSILIAITCHLFFQFIIFADLSCSIIFFLYIILFANMIQFRNENDWIHTKDIIRTKILMNYIYIGVASIVCLFIYSIVFGNKFDDIYDMTSLFYILSIPMYLLALLFRKEAKKYAKSSDKSKNGYNDGDRDDSIDCNGGIIDESDNVWLVQRESYIRRRNNAISNLIGYGTLLFISNATGTLRFYIGFMISISLIRYIAEPFLIRNGYFVKHCDAWKDCFSSTHLLYFIALYFCIQSNYDISVLLTMATIANFETVRRQDNV